MRKRDEDDSLLKEFRRLSRMVDDFLTVPADQRNAGTRLALIDDLQTLRTRLLVARDRVGGNICQSRAAFVAASAYGRNQRLRG